MQWVIEQTVDLQHAIPHGAWPEPLAVTGDSQAHEWRVRILENGAPAALDGCSCKGYFVRGDGQTVLAEGSIAEAIAAVVLPQACYAVPGAVRGLLRISRDGVVMTAAVLSLHVIEGPGDAIVDPGEVIPSLDELLAQVAAMEALNDDVSAAEAGRVAAEQGRVQAEQEREATIAQIEQDAENGEYDGATFLPAVSADGVISWTNDKGLANPASVNIKGADGEDGLSVELRLSDAYLQWRPTDGVWQNLIALSEITGPAGADGADGQNPTISIGTVTRAETTSEASATLTGTYPAYVLNLVLPKGDTGATGATGPTGPKGDDGVSPIVSVSKSGKVTTITIVDATGTHTATINDGADGSGTGDMVRATYDANENGIVDDAEKLGGQLPEHYASVDDLAEKASLPVSDTPPEDSEFWVDTGVSPTMLRRWRGADVPTGREYQQTISADTGSASLSIDNAQGQLRSVALEMGCVAKQAGTGDPSPENIRAIIGRESVEIAACGKNLFDLSDLYASGSNTGMDISVSSVRVYTTGEGGTWRGAKTPDFVIHAGVTYTLSATLSSYVSGYARVGLRGADNNAFVIGASLPFNATTGKLSTTYTPDADDEVYLSILCTNGTLLTGDCTFTNIQLEIGSTATEYEPYRSMGGGTITPSATLYGLPEAEDTVEVSVDGDVLVTRRTAIVEFDGTENWTAYNAGVSGEKRMRALPETTPGIQPPPNNNTAANLLCSHYLSVPATTGGTYERVTGISVHASEKAVYIYDEQYSDGNVEAWKSYLATRYAAGTPVTVVYEMAEATTETPAAVDPIVPQPGAVNIFTDADTLSATITGSGWDTIGDMGGLEAQLAEKVDAADLATVATSGSYNDLTDKPNIAEEIDVDTTITEGGTNPVTGGAIYTALAGKADAGDIPAGLLQSAFHGTVSLLSTGWTQGDDSWYSQTVTATGVTATAIVYVAFHPDSRSAFLDAGIYCSAQAANQLTFKAASQPESNISVNVHAMEVSA